MIIVPLLLAVRRSCFSLLALLLFGLLPTVAQGQLGVMGWPGYGGNRRHTALSPVRAQPLRAIRWSTPVDLQPQFSGNDLLIHYGSPLITRNNTVLVPVKTGASDGFQVEAHRGVNGALLWTQASDYSLPAHGWTPSFGGTLTPDNRLVFPGAGGTVYIRANPDAATGSLTQVAFYGMDNYRADPSTYNTYVKICTPITSDGSGNLYFGFVATGPTALTLASGLARISSTGVGTWIAAQTAANNDQIKKIVYNCAPALSNDDSTVYVAVSNSADSGFSTGFLLALDSTTLQLKSRALLTDPANPQNFALLADDGTAAPMIGPDGDVYFGVLENPFPNHHARGWLLHFSGDLSQAKTPGSFGWDDTASVVPAGVVPSYQGSSAYLLLTKYNNYVEGGGDGVNRVAVLDPNAAMLDPFSGAMVMQEVIAIAGPTPDMGFRPNYPNAVREWCINSAVVDPFSKSALVNNEDGKLYRWDFATNTLTETITLTPGIGEAYTPTLVGPDGTVFAINNATLFAVGLPAPYGTTLRVADATTAIGQPAGLRALLRRSADGFVVVGKTLTFSVDGTVIGNAVTGLDGLATLSYTTPLSLGAGSHALTVSFMADTDYLGSTVTGTLTSRFNTVTNVADAVGSVGQTIGLRALLRRKPDGAVVAGKTFTFKIDGVAVGTAVTAANGLATLNYTLTTDMTSGDKTLSAEFAGEGDYNPSRGFAVLSVGFQTVTTIANASGKAGQAILLRALLRRRPDGLRLPGKTLIFKVAGAQVGTAITGSDGLATLSYTIPADAAAGDTTLAAEFAGDSSFKASSGSGTLTINP